VPGRMELIDEGQPFGVIVDYAHSPDALERLLDAVRECGPNRLITGVKSSSEKLSGPLESLLSASRYSLPCYWFEEEPLTSGRTSPCSWTPSESVGQTGCELGGTYWRSKTFLDFEVLPEFTGHCRPYVERSGEGSGRRS
jgi:hypothetical protein